MNSVFFGDPLNIGRQKSIVSLKSSVENLSPHWIGKCFKTTLTNSVEEKCSQFGLVSQNLPRLATFGSIWCRYVLWKPALEVRSKAAPRLRPARSSSLLCRPCTTLHHWHPGTCQTGKACRSLSRPEPVRECRGCNAKVLSTRSYTRDPLDRAGSRPRLTAPWRWSRCPPYMAEPQLRRDGPCHRFPCSSCRAHKGMGSLF